MKHNFLTGLLVFFAAYIFMHVVAITLLGPTTYWLSQWPINTLAIFLPFYIVAAGYGFTQADDDTRFEYAKDASDGVLLGFLSHYTVTTWGFLETLIVFLCISIAYRFIGSVIKISREAN